MSTNFNIINKDIASLIAKHASPKLFYIHHTYHKSVLPGIHIPVTIVKCFAAE